MRQHEMSGLCSMRRGDMFYLEGSCPRFPGFRSGCFSNDNTMVSSLCRIGCLFARFSEMRCLHLQGD